jgi:lipid-A-disaccharide synthase
VLPGSRRGEAARHLPALVEAVDRLYGRQAASFVLPASVTTGEAFFRDRIGRAPIHVIQGEAWDAIAHADLALAASGTVTVEAALLGTPMVTFYRVTAVSWILGRLLVRVPFYSMVNLIAGRAVVPELMQARMTGERLAEEAARLLRDEGARDRMRADLREVARKLSTERGSIERAAAIVQELMEGEVAHVS